MAGQVTAVTLGITQDGSLPHVGCRCPRCAAAYADPRRAEFAACLGIVDGRGDAAKIWLIDATPDIKYQLNWLADALGPHPARAGRLRQPDAIFLTHGHMGHVSGLAQLGPEAMAAQDLPVYATPDLLALLRENKLWRPLVNNLDLRPLSPNKPIQLAANLHLMPIPVPHRDEWNAGTLAFRLQGPNQSLLYLPDIDAWEQWPEARDTLAGVDVAVVDACFYGPGELDGRSPVAHPFIPHTLALFADLPAQLVLTHLNHTNPVLDPGSAERKAVLEAGARVAEIGQTFPL